MNDHNDDNEKILAAADLLQMLKEELSALKAAININTPAESIAAGESNAGPSANDGKEGLCR